MNKKAKLSIATLVVMVAAGSALYGYNHISKTTTATTNARGGFSRGLSFQVVVEPVKKSDVAGGQMFTGSITPSSVTNLASKINGKVTAMQVKIGDRVKKGQALAKIDTTTLEQSIKQSEGSAAVSSAQWTKAQDDQGNSVTSAQKAADLQKAQAAKTLNDQQSSVANAKQALTIAQASLVKAQKDQQTSIASSKQALATAQLNLDKARSDAASAVTNAQNAVEQAQTNLQNAQNNSTTNYQALQSAYALAQSNYTAALRAANNDINDPTVQTAYAKVTQAQTALTQAQGSPTSVVSAQNALTQAQAQLTNALNSQSVQIAQQAYNQALLNLASAQSSSALDVQTQQYYQAQLALANAQAASQGTSNTVQAQLAQSAQSLTTAQSTDSLKVSEASYNQAMNNLKVLTEQLQDGTLVAPTDGLVTAISAPVGQMSSGTILSVATDPMLATVNVPESIVSKLKVGTPMDVTVQTLGKTFTGKVYAIHPGLDATTKSYPVDVQVDDPNHELLPGMFAQASLKSTGRQGIMVPADTVQSEASGNYVYVETNNRVHKVQVQLGVVTSSQFEITSGLKEGDKIVVKGEELLSDNLPVQVVTADQYGKNVGRTGGGQGGAGGGQGGAGGGFGGFTGGGSGRSGGSGKGGGGN
ncbi:MAG: efflux RND transporter periplasmic adaptor subunit [Tumebacillaceae bacterium]